MAIWEPPTDAQQALSSIDVLFPGHGVHGVMDMINGEREREGESARARARARAREREREITYMEFLQRC